LGSAGVRYYGEAEFWFSFIKVITIVGLIILGIILDLGGGPNHDRIGFRYWKEPGAFNQYNGIQGAKGRFVGLLNSHEIFNYVDLLTVSG
jgi:yeast amino acid transporter